MTRLANPMHIFRHGLLILLLSLLGFSSASAVGPELVAYLPYYRLTPIRGAETQSGRSAYDPAPLAWAGRTRGDLVRTLPTHWKESNWPLRLVSAYDMFYLQISLSEDMLEGRIPDLNHMDYLQNLKTAGGDKIGISIHGGSNVFVPLVSSETTLESFVEQLADLTREYGLDAVDLNWEFYSDLRESDKQGMARLAAGIRSRLPESAILSASVNRRHLPSPEFFKSIDRVNIMAFDNFGRHSTMESMVADVETILARVDVEPEDIVLGLPFYGRIYKPESPDYWSGTKNYRGIVEEFDPSPADDEAGDYAYNGQNTIRKKFLWASERGLGGVFVWEPYYDMFGPLSLSQLLVDTKNIEWQ